MDQPALELQSIRRTFGSVVAVDEVSVKVGKGEFLTLLGPSGSGKTSTLRLIGGFERPESGTIKINGERVDHLPPYARDTATIFQTGALFPHKTVGENIAYGLRMRGFAKLEVTRRTGEALEIVRLSGFEDRLPVQLSGGQKQRVALARSMAVRPAILLFDEPLSALDLSLRLQLRAEIKRLHDEIGFSAIYVTHDQGEAMAMSSRVAVMNKGKIAQIGTPQDIFNKPESEFVFKFIGESCCIPVNLSGRTATTEDGEVVDLRLSSSLANGNWRLYVRPSRLLIGARASACENQIAATVAFTEFLGDFWRYHLRASSIDLFCDYAGSERFAPGEVTTVGWDSGHMSAFQ